MQYLKNYLNKIIAQGNEKLAESISHTAEEVGNKYIKNFSFTSHEIGLLFGNVQSGKTGQMFGIISKATVSQDKEVCLFEDEGICHLTHKEPGIRLNSGLSGSLCVV